MKYLIKLFSPVFLIFSLFILFNTYYRANIFHSGELNDYYSIYYKISLSLIVFSILTFFLNKKIKEYVVISTISIFVSLYLAETYIVFKDQLKKNFVYKKQTKKKYDNRSKLEVYEDLKKTYKNIKISILPSQFNTESFRMHSLSGISNSKTIFCNENGYYSIYESDRYGFNNPDKEWLGHKNDNVEYMLVGDSFTHGACVNRPNDIASVLRILSGKSVLNLGHNRNGPLLEYATLKEYIFPKVNKILWIYFEGNDLIDLDYELNNEILKKYYDDINFTQNLKFRQKYIDDFGNKQIDNEAIRARKNKNFKIFQFVKLYNLRNFGKIRSTPEIFFEFKTILELTKHLAKKNNSKLYFVYLPEYTRYKVNYDNSNYNKVKNIVKDLKIPFIDIHSEIFMKEKNPLAFFPFELTAHYNEEGYKNVAKTIYNYTKDE